MKTENNFKFAVGDKVINTEDYSVWRLIKMQLTGPEGNFYTVTDVEGVDAMMLIPEDKLIPLDMSLLRKYPERNEDGTFKAADPDNLPGKMYKHLFGTFNYSPIDNGEIFPHTDLVIKVVGDRVEIYHDGFFRDAITGEKSKNCGSNYDVFTFGDVTYYALYALGCYHGYNLPSFHPKVKEWITSIIENPNSSINSNSSKTKRPTNGTKEARPATTKEAGPARTAKNGKTK